MSRIYLNLKRVNDRDGGTEGSEEQEKGDEKGESKIFCTPRR